MFCEFCPAVGVAPCSVCGRGRTWVYDVYVQLVAAGWERETALALARSVVC